MLRTNINFLSYVEQFYQAQAKEDIIQQKYSKGEFIFEQNKRSNKVIIIKDGFVKCFFNEENGKYFVVEFLGKGEVIGEIEAIKGIHCLCNVEALSEVKVYSFSTTFFKSMMNKDIKFNQLLVSELAERIINTSSRASYQQLYSIKHGLSKLLILQEKQNIKIPKIDMAAYLGIDVRSLNRVLKTIQSDSK